MTFVWVPIESLAHDPLNRICETLDIRDQALLDFREKDLGDHTRDADPRL
jgi:hypothetical protein